MPPARLPKMTPTAEGGWTARKVIPEDVQDEYQRLYAKKYEERFNSGPVPVALARQNLASWFNKIEARIERRCSCCLEPANRSGDEAIDPSSTRVFDHL